MAPVARLAPANDSPTQKGTCVPDSRPAIPKTQTAKHVVPTANHRFVGLPGRARQTKAASALTSRVTTTREIWSIRGEMCKTNARGSASAQNHHRTGRRGAVTLAAEAVPGLGLFESSTVSGCTLPRRPLAASSLAGPGDRVSGDGVPVAAGHLRRQRRDPVQHPQVPLGRYDLAPRGPSSRRV